MHVCRLRRLGHLGLTALAPHAPWHREVADLAIELEDLRVRGYPRSECGGHDRVQKLRELYRPGMDLERSAREEVNERWRTYNPIPGARQNPPAHLDPSASHSPPILG